MKKRRFIFTIGLILILLYYNSISIKARVIRDMDFIDHGVASPVSESRGIIAACDKDKEPIILVCSMDNYKSGLRTSLLIIHVNTGETEQYWYPSEDVANDAVYSLLLSKENKLYIMPAGTFLEFDIVSRQWTFAKSVSGNPAMSFAEGPDGIIYTATYPDCSLYSFNPKTQEFIDYGQLDPVEQYPSFLAVDSAGWVYCGIGTSKSNLVAFNPKTRESKQIAKEKERVTGSGTVYLGTDGKVYGRVSGSGPYYRLYKGKGKIIGLTGLPKAPVKTINWGNMIAEFPTGGRIVQLRLEDRKAMIRDIKGKLQEITFDYKSEGTAITSLVAGPDGRVYGSTCHPMHFFVYDPETDLLEDWGGIERIGGGNFCNMAIQDGKLIGCAYAGGYLYSYDMSKPWNNETVNDHNPKLLSQYPKDIARPRAILAYPDGKHVIMAGFPGYGLVGGGMAIYDLKTGKSTLLTNDKIIKGQSTITLKVLQDGNLIGGTSIAAPGGGTPIATEGMLYIMDWKTKEIIFKTAPIPSRIVFETVRLPGAAEVSSIEVGANGLVYGIASDSQFFVFDPSIGKVINRISLKEFGNPVGASQSIVIGPDKKIYIILSNAILRMEPETLAYSKLATPPEPITAGIALQGKHIYFACGSHLWSYTLEYK